MAVIDGETSCHVPGGALVLWSQPGQSPQRRDGGGRLAADGGALAVQGCVAKQAASLRCVTEGALRTRGGMGAGCVPERLRWDVAASGMVAVLLQVIGARLAGCKQR